MIQGTIRRSIGALLTCISLAGCDGQESSPYTVMKSDIKLDVGAGSQKLFHWIDNDRLLVMASEGPDPTPRGRMRQRQSMKVWHIKTNTFEMLVPPDVDGLCADGDFIRFHALVKGNDGLEALAFYTGRIGAIQRTYALGEFNKMTCTLTRDDPLPDWAQQLPAINVKRLRPEHGFLVIDQEENAITPRRILFAKHGLPERSTLDITHQVLDASPKNTKQSASYAGSFGMTINFFEFRNAYHVTTYPQTAHVWLYADGTVEPSDLYLHGTTPKGIDIASTIATAKDSLGSAWDVHQEVFIGDSGLYSFPPDTSPERIVKGRIGQEIEVSPSGCLVAFANDDRFFINPTTPMRIYKLQVINLCPETSK